MDLKRFKWLFVSFLATISTGIAVFSIVNSLSSKDDYEVVEAQAPGTLTWLKDGNSFTLSTSSYPSKDTTNNNINYSYADHWKSEIIATNSYELSASDSYVMSLKFQATGNYHSSGARIEICPWYVSTSDFLLFSFRFENGYLKEINAYGNVNGSVNYTGGWNGGSETGEWHSYWVNDSPYDGWNIGSGSPVYTCTIFRSRSNSVDTFRIMLAKENDASIWDNTYSSSSIGTRTGTPKVGFHANTCDTWFGGLTCSKYDNKWHGVMNHSLNNVWNLSSNSDITYVDNSDGRQYDHFVTADPNGNIKSGSNYSITSNLSCSINSNYNGAFIGLMAWYYNPNNWISVGMKFTGSTNNVQMIVMGAVNSTRPYYSTTGPTTGYTQIDTLSGIVGQKVVSTFSSFNISDLSSLRVEKARVAAGVDEYTIFFFVDDNYHGTTFYIRDTASQVDANAVVSYGVTAYGTNSQSCEYTDFSANLLQKVTVASGGHGNVSATSEHGWHSVNNVTSSASFYVDYGEKVNLIASADTHYTFSSWSDGGASTHTTAMIKSNTTFTASFSAILITVTIAVNNDYYGSVNHASVNVLEGSTYSVVNNVLTFSDGNTVTPTPTTSDAQYTYAFSGWSSTSGVITSAVTITANFTRSENTYTITWKNYDGAILETDTNVAFGTTPSYDGDTPSRPNVGTSSYTFTGWSPAVVSVSGDATYTAQFREDVISTKDITIMVATTDDGSKMPNYTTFYNTTVALYCYDVTGYEVTVEAHHIDNTRLCYATVPADINYIKVVRITAGASATPLPFNDWPGDQGWTVDNEWNKMSFQYGTGDHADHLTKNLIQIDGWGYDNQYWESERTILPAGMPVYFNTEINWWFNDDTTPYLVTGAINDYYGYTKAEGWHELTKFYISEVVDGSYAYMYFIPDETIIAPQIILTRNTTNTPGWSAKQNQTTDITVPNGFYNTTVTDIESGKTGNNQNWGNKGIAETMNAYGALFLDYVTCTGAGSIDEADWDTVSNHYDNLGMRTQERIKQSLPNESGSLIEQAMARYDYIVFYKKYSGYDDFINREDANNGRVIAGMVDRVSLLGLYGDDALSTIIIIISSSVSLLSITAISVLLIKKKKTR